MRSHQDRTFALHGIHSACALISCSVAWAASLGAIVGGMILYVLDDMNPLELFKYFTTLTNVITTIGSGLLFPFAVEGFRRKSFSCPRWATMFFYSGTVCSTLTMLIATLVISWFDPVMAFGGYNIYLHVICPLLTILTFFLVESDSHYRTRDAVICILPAAVYAIVYIIEVVYVGSARGGWEDLYHVATLLPPIVLILLVILLSFGLAQLIRVCYERLCAWRMKRFVKAHLIDDLSKAEVRLEILDLGEHIGRNEDENFVVLPLKSLSIVAEKYSIRREELVMVYTRALVDTMDERRAHASTHRRNTTSDAKR